MTIDQVLYYLDIIKTRSINKTATHFMLPHQSVSLAMRNLEEELGYSLLARSPKGVLPTETGLASVPYFKDIATAYRNLQNLHENELVHLKGQLSVVAAPFFTLITSSDFPAYFLKAYPNINLNLKIQENLDIIKYLNHKTDDLYIFVSDLPETSLKELIDTKRFDITPVLNDPLYAIFSTSHPLSQLKSLSIDTLCGYPYALYQSSENSENLTFKYFKQCGQPNIKYRTDHLSSLLEVISTSDTFTFVPELCLKRNNLITNNKKLSAIKVKDMPILTLFYITEKNLTSQKAKLIHAFKDYFDRYMGQNTRNN